MWKHNSMLRGTGQSYATEIILYFLVAFGYHCPAPQLNASRWITPKGNDGKET